MTDSGEWTGRVGTAWAQEWQRTDRSFAGLTRVLLDETRIGAFAAALDIGCGAGEVAVALARAHRSAQVLGIDIAADLIAVARIRGRGIANLAFAEADAADWSAGSGQRPDLLISRHGVMFFADPVAAFAQLCAAAAPGARLRFSCFRAPADNAGVQALAAALPPSQAVSDPHAPGPFAFADCQRVSAILAAAGWAGIAFEPVDYEMIAGQTEDPGEDAVDDALAYFQRIGPAARALAELPSAARPRALERLRAVIQDHHADGLVAMSAAAWIVSACKR